MQILITQGHLARHRVVHLSRSQTRCSAAAGVLVLLLLLSGTVYHFVFLKAAREGWPVVSQIVRLVVRDEIAQRDRFMRENLDAMAAKVGEMQAKLRQARGDGRACVGAGRRQARRVEAAAAQRRWRPGRPLRADRQRIA